MYALTVLMAYLRDALRQHQRRRVRARLRYLLSSVAYIESALREPGTLTQDQQEELRALLVQQRKALGKALATHASIATN